MGLPGSSEWRCEELIEDVDIMVLERPRVSGESELRAGLEFTVVRLGIGGAASISASNASGMEYSETAYLRENSLRALVLVLVRRGNDGGNS
jgi:hypothetical protein